MPAPLRDVRVVSPAVNLPGPLAAVPLAVFAASGIPGRQAQRTWRLHRHRAPARLSWRMLTDLPCELKRSPWRYGLQAICGTASAAVIERQ